MYPFHYQEVQSPMKYQYYSKVKISLTGTPVWKKSENAHIFKNSRIEINYNQSKLINF